MMRFSTQTHRFYCGVDLHARTLSLCVLDDQGTKRLERTLPAHPGARRRSEHRNLLAFLVGLSHPVTSPWASSRAGSVADPILSCRTGIFVTSGRRACLNP